MENALAVVGNDFSTGRRWVDWWAEEWRVSRMDGWMVGWTDERMNGWMSEWMDGCKDEGERRERVWGIKVGCLFKWERRDKMLSSAPLVLKFITQMNIETRMYSIQHFNPGGWVESERILTNPLHFPGLFIACHGRDNVTLGCSSDVLRIHAV